MQVEKDFTYRLVVRAFACETW